MQLKYLLLLILTAGHLPQECGEQQTYQPKFLPGKNKYPVMQFLVNI